MKKFKIIIENSSVCHPACEGKQRSEDGYKFNCIFFENIELKKYYDSEDMYMDVLRCDKCKKYFK